MGASSLRGAPPRTLTALRAVLWTMAVLLLWSAVLVAVMVGGAVGVGSGTVRCVPAVLCAVCALRLPRYGRLGYRLTLAFLAVMVLSQMARLVESDPLGPAGLAIAVTALVLLLAPQTRRYLRSS